MPSTRMWYFQSNSRFLGQSTLVTVSTPRLVAIEVRIIYKSYIGLITFQLNYYNRVTFNMAKLVIKNFNTSSNTHFLPSNQRPGLPPLISS